MGKKGEDIATMFLVKRGYKIICRNYRRKWGELDIVGHKDEVLHFFEVKTVSRDLNVTHETGDRYRAEDNLHSLKLRRLSRIIQTYLVSERVHEKQKWQFNVITVLLDEKQRIARVEMLEDIIL